MNLSFFVQSLQFCEPFFFQKTSFFLFRDILVEENTVGAQGNFKFHAHFSFVLRKFLTIFKEVGNGYELFIIGVVHGVIVHFFQIQLGFEVRESFGQTSFGQQTVVGVVTCNARIELQILQSHGRIQFSHVLVGRHFSKLVGRRRKSRFVDAFNIFPKR